MPLDIYHMQLTPRQYRNNQYYGWLAFVTLILFAAFAFRLWNLGTQSLWHDEAWSIQTAYRFPRPLDPNSPPYFMTLQGLWIQVAGDSVWVMRYFSLLFGLATVAVATLIARRWFGRRAAAITAILVAASPILWVYSQEIRSYIAVALLALIFLALAQALLRPQPKISRRVWLWLLVVELITLYVHNLSVPLVAWLNLTVIAVWLFRREWRRILIWLVLQAGLLVLYLPWLLTQQPTGTALNTPPSLGIGIIWDIWQAYFTGIKAMIGADPLLMVFTAVFGILALIGVVAAVILRPTQRTFITLSQVILIPLFELVIVLAAHIDFHPRYFIVGVPATLLLIAAGWDTLAYKFTSPQPLSVRGEGLSDGINLQRMISAIPIFVLLTFALAVTIRMATLLYGNAGYQHDDFRAIAEHYAQLGSDDAIIIPYGWDPTIDYYSHKLNFKARIIGIPLHADAQTILTQLQSDLAGVNRVELLTWYQLPADLRGAYPCVLGVDRVLDKSLTYTGIHTDSYVIPGTYAITVPDEPVVKTINFGDKLTLTSSQSWSGRAGTCVISQWLLKQPSLEIWSIAARALNPLGWEIARSDSALLNDLQQPTSLWKSDKSDHIETAFSTLKLPDGAVNRSLPVTFTVYSSQTPSGLDVLQEGKIMGKNAEVAQVSGWFTPTITVKPTIDDVDMGDGLYLHHNERPYGPFQPGQEVRVPLEWWQTHYGTDTQTVTVSLEGNGWRVTSDGSLYPAPKVLTWHALIIPATAKGSAVLKATAPNGKSISLGEYDVMAGDHTFVEPAVTQQVKGDFAEVGALVGVDVPQIAQRSEPFKVRLVWRASATPKIAYTVFVHLLDSAGKVIAQSDAQPAQGQRPTTSWVTNEYIDDVHALTFNRQDYTGSATLEVGLYDAATGKRVSLTLVENAPDHLVLPLTIDVR
ncbi:MAG: glycosyltransferase family 39 protein [Chloroflexota bacterium]